MQQDKAPITKELIDRVNNTATSSSASVDGRGDVVRSTERLLNRNNYERYKISDFYNPKTIIKALKSVNPRTKWFKHHLLGRLLKSDEAIIEKYGSLEKANEFIDDEAIRQQLLKHPDEILKYFDKIKDAEMLVSHHNNLPPQNTDEFKKLTAFVKKGKRTITHTVTKSDVEFWQKNQDYLKELQSHNKDVKNHLGYGLPKPELGKVETQAFEGWVVDDAKGLLEAIKSYALNTGYRIVNDYDIYTNSVSVLGGELLNMYDLAEACGIEPQSDYVEATINTDGNEKHLLTDHRVMLSYLTRALAEQLKAYLKKTDDKRRARANLKDGHDGLPRPATTTLGELFESATINSDRLIKIYDDYRTPEALQEAGGYKVRATQSLLPIFKASNDYKTLQAMIRANIPQLEKVLITLLREAQHTGGLNNEPRWSRVADLAKPMYEAQIARRGKLDTKYKQAYVDNLHFLDALQFYNFEKPSKRNKGGGIYTKFKFIEIKKLDVNKKGIVTDVEWRLSDDFVKLVPYLIFVNTDNFLRLQSPHAQMLATYINDSFVKSAKRTDDTIAGLPITISAKTLADKAGLSDSNTTDRYKLLTESLNEIKAQGIIEKWATEDGDTVIRSQNNKLPKVVIFPSENVSNSYVSKRLNAGAKQQERLEQAKRQDELRTLLGYYRKDLKQNKWATEYKQALAEDLGTTTGKIDLMLLKPSKTQKPDEIGDEMLAKIRELLSNYEGD